MTLFRSSELYTDTDMVSTLKNQFQTWKYFLGYMNATKQSTVLQYQHHVDHTAK